VIDPSQAPDGLTVHYGVSPDLDELKAMYFGLPDLLAAVARHEAARLPPHSAAAAAAARGGWEVLYLPQVGFVLQAGGELLGSDVLESVGDYELAFDGGGGAGHAQHADFDGGRGVDVAAAGACYHTDTTRELTQRYGDLLLKVRDLEGAVCCQLAARLGASAGAVRAGAGAAAHLDCLLSLAGAAVELTLVRPRLVEEPVLRVRGGRHLLAEQLLPAGAFIPNDTRMGGADARLHVLTGPNLSGKSCYSRGVALIAFLAHVGSFVPADEAEVGVVDRIFTRVATREAASVPQSSFLIDLSQVAAMLRLATPRSLLIIDEFGKGTLASDGVGLVCGAAAHLAAAGAAGCPRALLCTHFTEVLDPGYLPRNPMMAFYTMGVVVEEEEGGERGRGRGRGDDTGGGGGGGGGGGLVFLYRILPGQVGPSFGVHCARAAGVDVSVLARAEEVIAAHARGEAPPQAAAPPALAARGAAFEGLVQGLLALDTRSAVDCRALVEAVAAATADA
jgi:DNA mismatch repair protein MSH5